MARLTKHRQAEKTLTAYGLTFPETSLEAGFKLTRQLSVLKKGFCVFGWDKPHLGPEQRKGAMDAANELSLCMKLPVSAEMVEGLWFVRPASGWFKQHNWVIAHFGPDDDPHDEMETLKGWLVQSYCAVAPKRLAKVVRELHA